MPLSGHGRAGCCPVFTGCRYSLIQDRIVCKTNYDNQVGSAHHVRIAKTRLMAQKAELEKEQRGAAAFESRLAELDMALEQASGTLTDFDELTVRQLVSNIKVLDKDSLLICFKDGTEITQAMQRRQAA